jgi:hypothetical protein
MAMEYKMVDEVTLKNFKRFMRSGIPLREFSPGGAFDSAIEEPARERRDYIDAMDELAGKVSPEAFDTICDAIRAKWAKDRKARDGEQFETPEERSDAESFPNAKRASDEPPYFKGRPKTGGAMDGMAFDGPPRRKSKADKSFENMYGSAALNIKNADLYPTATRTRA